MRAIIISAGQGRRLLPLTRSTPKCLLPVHDGRSLLELQLQTLAQCGVTDVSVMVGFGADQVEECIRRDAPTGMTVRCCYNPFYASSDNLVTVWLARSEMRGDFLLLNGDTLFESRVVSRLLNAHEAAVTLAVDIKKSYDDDDMKVQTSPTGRLLAVGKTLKREHICAESIGFMLFRGDGVEAFRSALDTAVRDPENVHSWYLSVINSMAHQTRIQTCSIEGLWWGEVDSPEDLSEVRSALEELASDAEQTPEDAAAGRRLTLAQGVSR